MAFLDTVKTGENIKTLVKKKNIKIVDLKDKLGFGTPQAIYKWFKGEAMPTLDNLVILAAVLEEDIGNIIVTTAV